MDLWQPTHDQPHMLEWWRPLISLSARARVEDTVWPVNVDEFSLVGRVNRRDRPDIWVYRHHGSGGELFVDGSATVYKYTWVSGGSAPGRFTKCDLYPALWRAGIPQVTIARTPTRSAGFGPNGGWGDDDLGTEPTEPPSKTHGHLRVYDGGMGA